MIVLNADDYAMTDGLSRGIVELAAARRLSATSVMTTMPGWTIAAARSLQRVRGEIAIGLHLNLTLGAPLGDMARLAPAGRLPALGPLVLRALAGQLDAAEIGHEIARQLDAFETLLGFPPDHVDGHQHVQVLAGVRGPLLAELRRRYPAGHVLVRDPADRLARLARQGAAGVKGAVVALLSAGFAPAVRQHGFAVNDGFSGFSAFDTGRSYAAELAAAMGAARGCHIVMCHPGYPDATLAALDPVVERRRQEFDALMGEADLARRIWRPSRTADGPPVDWSQVTQ